MPYPYLLSSKIKVVRYQNLNNLYLNSLQTSMSKYVTTRCPVSKSNALIKTQCNGSNMERSYLTRAHWGGVFRAPSSFLAISSKPMQISPPNLHNPLSQQFYTLCDFLSHHKSATKDVRVTSCSADFNQK